MIATLVAPLVSFFALVMGLLLDMVRLPFMTNMSIVMHLNYLVVSRHGVLDGVMDWSHCYMMRLWCLVSVDESVRFLMVWGHYNFVRRGNMFSSMVWSGNMVSNCGWVRFVVLLGWNDYVMNNMLDNATNRGSVMDWFSVMNWC